MKATLWVLRIAVFGAAIHLTYGVTAYYERVTYPRMEALDDARSGDSSKYLVILADGLGRCRGEKFEALAVQVNWLREDVETLEAMFEAETIWSGKMQRTWEAHTASLRAIDIPHSLPAYLYQYPFVTAIGAVSLGAYPYVAWKGKRRRRR